MSMHDHETNSKHKIILCGRSLYLYPRDETLFGAIHTLYPDCYDLRYIEKLWITAKKGKFQKLKKLVRHGIWFILFGLYLIRLVKFAYHYKGSRIIIFPGNHFFCLLFSLINKRFHLQCIVMYDNWISIYSASQSGQYLRVRQKIRFVLEKAVNHHCQHLFVLSQEYLNYFTSLYGSSPQQYHIIPLCVDSLWLSLPQNNTSPMSYDVKVAYWGGFLTHHGLEVLLKASEILQHEPIQFLLYGDGPMLSHMQSMIQEKNLNHVFIKGYYEDDSDLIREIDKADITVGHLKDSHDAQLIGPNKLIQGLSRGKSVISIYSKHLENNYQSCHGEYPIVFFDGTAQDLAKQILYLKADLKKRMQLKQCAIQAAKEKHSNECLLNTLREVLESVSFNTNCH